MKKYIQNFWVRFLACILCTVTIVTGIGAGVFLAGVSAFGSKEELYELVGTMAEDNIYVYPPGSYIVVAGEEITKKAIDKIIELKASGKRILGL